MLALATAVYLIVSGLVIFTVARRRRAVPEHFGHRLILVGGLLVPVAILAVLATFTVRTTNALIASDGAVQVHVAGEQWWWRVTYPDLQVITANEIHVPVGRSVTVTLTSDNVIHSFWVPQLGGKTDLIPGQSNHLTFTVDAPGTYRGQCAEFCGREHARMAFLVIADDPATFDRWVDDQRRVPATPTDALAVRGRNILVTGSCAGCHTVAGTAAAGTSGPDLTHIASRATLAAETIPNTPDEMAHWLAYTQQVKPGALMPQIDLSAGEVRALVAYLDGLR